MLLGQLPLGRSIRLPSGRSVLLDIGALEEFAYRPGLLIPVLANHDPDRLVGWCDRVSFNRRQQKALLYGDIDAGLPGAKGVARLVRSHTMDGLSPAMKTTRGMKEYAAVGRYGPGDLVEFKEVSVTWVPQVADARWLGV